MLYLHINFVKIINHKRMYIGVCIIIKKYCKISLKINPLKIEIPYSHKLPLGYHKGLRKLILGMNKNWKKKIDSNKVENFEKYDWKNNHYQQTWLIVWYYTRLCESLCPILLEMLHIKENRKFFLQIKESKVKGCSYSGIFWPLPLF